MTPKELQHLTVLHGRITSGSFNETDVAAMLMIVRSYIGDGPVKELSHNVAHNDRDRGRFYDRIFGNKHLLDNLGKVSGTIVSGDVFSVADFGKQLNRVFKQSSLAPLSDATMELVLLCIMSLLQDGTFKKKKLAELSLAVSASDFLLCATIPVARQGKEVKVAFPVLSVKNRWLPIANPRANLSPSGLVNITIVNAQPIIAGFEPFEVYMERQLPISDDDLRRLLAADHRLQRLDDKTVRATSAEGTTLEFRWTGGKLTFDGRPEYLRSGTEFSAIIASAARFLGACVHDDLKAHWFLEGPEFGTPPDGFHCHWVGRGSATCTMPL